ncbi:MAG: glycine--tRNA ligase subunit beta [Eggerthellaceae bacterium]|nr:glycine--tRNA ligase subunit beta [Eggerthellaceae bacterium]
MATLAFEIGTEEIPAFDLKNAVKQLHTLVPEALSAAKIPFGKVEIYSSPRRLVSMVYDIEKQTPHTTETFKGPNVSIAFDDAGNPTKAAIGFAKGKGVEVESLVKNTEGGVDYVYAVVEHEAKEVAEMLPEVLASIINGISWPKSCRWGITRDLFTRPVRWLLALLDTQVIPVSFAWLTADNKTRGHRVISDGTFPVKSADELLDTLRWLSIVPSEEEREEKIRMGVKVIERQTGLVAELPAHTLTEVVNLSENPTPMLCEFDPKFLDVPPEIIVDAMLVHQRYFPLYDKAHKLTNKFIIVSNGKPECADTIIEGNERVVAARLYDAKFFYDEDKKHPLESYVEKLKNVVFHESLGTVYDKTMRVMVLAEYLAKNARLSDEDAQLTKRAAYLCKADLVTSAVIEFTSVQGIMGSYYALASGEDASVASAIADHYKPRFAGDVLPEGDIAKCVAIADKLDTICGLFAAGQGPTGSSDPFALRRSSIGIINMVQSGIAVSLDAAIDACLNIYRTNGLSFDKDEVLATVKEFFVTRTKVMLKDGGCAPDAIEAVCAIGVTEPVDIIARVNALDFARNENFEVFDDLATAYARANNLRDANLGSDYDEGLFNEVETEFVNSISYVNENLKKSLAEKDYPQALNVLSSLRVPVDNFFEKVMIMDEDPIIKANRIKLLNAFVAVFAHVADFSNMAKKF